MLPVTSIIDFNDFDCFCETFLSVDSDLSKSSAFLSLGKKTSLSLFIYVLMSMSLKEKDSVSLSIITPICMLLMVSMLTMDSVALLLALDISLYISSMISS